MTKSRSYAHDAESSKSGPLTIAMSQQDIKQEIVTEVESAIADMFGGLQSQIFAEVENILRRFMAVQTQKQEEAIREFLDRQMDRRLSPGQPMMPSGLPPPISISEVSSMSPTISNRPATETIKGVPIFSLPAQISEDSFNIESNLDVAVSVPAQARALHPTMNSVQEKRRIPGQVTEASEDEIVKPENHLKRQKPIASQRAESGINISSKKYTVAGSIEDRVGAKLNAQTRKILLQKVEESDPMAKRGFRERLVDSDYFDYFMGLILAINAVVIGIQTNYNATHIGEQELAVWTSLNWMFTAIFLSELLLRLSVAGFKKFLTGPGWKWSTFDIIVISFSLLDLITQAAVIDPATIKMINNLGVLKMLRLGRIIRLVRMVRLIPELKSMVLLIQASMGSFIWTVVLFLIMIYCLAIYYTDAATDIITSLQADGDPNGAIPAAQQYFGTLGTTHITMFAGISGGDWTQYLGVLKVPQNNMFLVNTLVMATYVAFSVLVMLNLVTGVFVEHTANMMQDDRENAILNLAVQIFTRGGRDLEEGLSLEEFADILESGVLSNFCRQAGLSQDDIENMYYILDTDKSGTLQLQEFAVGLIKLIAVPKTFELAILRDSSNAIIKMLEEGLTQASQRLVSIENTMVKCFLTHNFVGQPPEFGHAEARPGARQRMVRRKQLQSGTGPV